MEIQRCPQGHVFDASNRFCPICGYAVAAPSPIDINALLRQDPDLADFREPRLISSDAGVYRYRVMGKQGAVTLSVVDCGTDSRKLEQFQNAMFALLALHKEGSAPAVSGHIRQNGSGHLGFLIEEFDSLPTLEQRLRSGAMTVQDAVMVGIQLCWALHSCRNIPVCMDISPKTILVLGEGKYGLNSSCVSLAAPGLPRSASMEFVAPEQRGREEALPPSRVWSLGMVLQHLLCNAAGQIPEAGFADCIRQTIAPGSVQRSIVTPEQLRMALMNAGSQLQPWQLARSLTPEAPKAAPSFSAPRQTPFYAPAAPAEACSRPAAPAPASAAAKKGGLLSRLFQKKQTPSRAAPPPAPSAAPGFSPPPSAPSQAYPITAVGSCAPAPSQVYPITGVGSCAPAPSQVYPITGIGSCPAPAPSQTYPITGCPPQPDPVYSAPPSAPAPYPTTAPMAAPSCNPAPAYAPPPRVDRVQFSAVAPKEASTGDYSIIQLFMYEQEFRQVVDEALAMMDTPAQEKRSGFQNVRENTRVKVVLTCPDFEIDDNENEQTWCGGYLQFDFAICVPEDFRKRQILLNAAVYFDDIPATRLMLMLKANQAQEPAIQVTRHDILSAFVSYASQDRARVAGLIQGMRKARPEMDIFFDVTTLRSGEDWEDTLFREILRRDILFLCWSQNAKKSPWVDQEWHYALEHKGIGCIEPIPLEPPDLCPPPIELSKKHFNDSLLYITR